MADDNSDVLTKIEKLWGDLDRKLVVLDRETLKQLIRDAIYESPVIKEIRSRVGSN